jgi:surface antigen
MSLKSMLLLAAILFMSQSAARAQTAPTDGATAVAVAESELPTDDGKGAGKHHVFPAGWCTRYAADTYRDRNRRDVTFRGNAKDWGVNASRAGYFTSTDVNRIVRNSILVFGPTRTNQYGHVAVVDNVVKGDYVVISEQNWKGFGIVSTRKIKWGDLRGRYGFTHVILP